MNDFSAIAIAGDLKGHFLPPCGACRQTLSEFNPNIVIYLVRAEDEHVCTTNLSHLFPTSFSPKEFNLDTICKQWNQLKNKWMYWKKNYHVYAFFTTYVLQKIHNYSIKLGKKEWIKALTSYLSTLMSWTLTKCTYKVTNRKIGKLLKLSYVDGYL